MKLGELKRALSRFPADVDDFEVILCAQEQCGKMAMDCLAGVSIPASGGAAVILMSDTALREYAEVGKARLPDGSIPELPLPPDHPDYEPPAEGNGS
jgi:hypothetical protein